MKFGASQKDSPESLNSSSLHTTLAEAKLLHTNLLKLPYTRLLRTFPTLALHERRSLSRI